MRAPRGLVLAALFVVALAIAPGPERAGGLAGSPTPAPPDPGAPGPYAIGVTWRSSTRALADGQLRTVGNRIWYPAAPDGGRAVDPALRGAIDAPPRTGVRSPVVVFSHGSFVTPDPYAHLLSHLASHGFVVAAPFHQDCPECRPRAAAYLAESLRRPDDVSALLDSLPVLGASDPVLGRTIDVDRIGVAGHSHGGHTALRLLQTDPRFLATLALMPATVLPPAIDPATVARPTMVVLGAWDNRAPAGIARQLYERIPAAAPDRWLLLFHRGGHGVWEQCADGIVEGNASSFRPCAEMLPQAEANAVVKRWGTAFLLRYVAGDARYGALLDPASATSSEYAVVRTPAGATAAGLPTVAPLPGGEAVVQEAVELVCRAGRTAACGVLRSGRVAVQFAPLQAVIAPTGFIPTPTLITLDAPYAERPATEVASLLVGAATYLTGDFTLSPSCAEVVRAETEQARFWRWVYPDARYPTASPRARRMLQVMEALGPDGVVRPERDPATDFGIFVPC